MPVEVEQVGEITEGVKEPAAVLNGELLGRVGQFRKHAGGGASEKWRMMVIQWREGLGIDAHIY